MASASNIVVGKNPVTDVAWRRAMHTLMGRTYSNAKAGLADF